jgi:hypothetical protein
MTLEELYNNKGRTLFDTKEGLNFSKYDIFVHYHDSNGTVIHTHLAHVKPVKTLYDELNDIINNDETAIRQLHIVYIPRADIASIVSENKSQLQQIIVEDKDTKPRRPVDLDKIREINESIGMQDNDYKGELLD